MKVRRTLPSMTDPIPSGKHLQAQLRTMQIVLDSLVEGVVWVNRAGIIQWCNTAFNTLVGSSSHAATVGHPLLELLPLHLEGNPIPLECHPVQIAIHNQPCGNGLYDWLQNNDRRTLQVSWTWRNSEEQAIAIFEIREVIQPQIANSAATNRQGEFAVPPPLQMQNGFYDPLTGLANRTVLLDRLEHAIQIGNRRSDYASALLCLDLDGFKVVNDSLGHQVGDQLLVAIAQRLFPCLHSGDTFARLGGDEFVILLEDLQSNRTAIQIVESIQQQFKSPFNLNGHEVFASASIGVVLSTTGYDHPEDLLRDGDTAMYRSKAKGRGGHEVFDAAMHAHAVALMQLEMDLRRAVNHEEFLLHYQPIVALRNNTLIGLEALVRWQHPTRGFISPAEFVPAAEETGLILPIGKWVLQEACRQMQVWHQQFPRNPPLFMSVNISAKQFTQPDLIEEVKAILDTTQLNPACLKLELTESALMGDVEAAIAMLNNLHALGIQLSIDDFGTGYSSLGYLNKFPIDTLKIDRSFVHNVDSDVEKLEIVKTIVMLAWNLGMDVVAEGVETQKQLLQLKALKCESGQGYFFSKPLDQNEVAALLTDSPLANSR